MHDAAEIILSSIFKFFSLTPKTIVLSAFLQGAETITFLAPFFKCANNLSLELNLTLITFFNVRANLTRGINY